MDKKDNKPKNQSEETIYSISLPCNRELGIILRELVKEKHGQLWRHLKQHVSEGILIAVQELEIELYDKIKTQEVPKPVSKIKE